MCANRRRLAMAGLPTLVLVAFSGPARGAVVMSPPATRVAVTPGGHARETVTITNDTAAPITAKVLLHDWTIGDGTSGSLAFHPPGTQPRSCTTRLQVVPDTFALAPGAAQEIELSISLPQDAAGSCFAALVVETSDFEQRGSARLHVRFGHLVTVDAAGRTQWKADLEELAVEAPTDVSPLVVSTRLVNLGDAGIRPETSFVVTDERGALVGRASAPVAYAQPGGTLPLVLEFEELFPPGRYRILGMVDIGGGHVLAPEATFAVEDRVRLDRLELAGAGETLAVVAHVDNSGGVSHELSGTVQIGGRTLPVPPRLILPGTVVAIRIPVGALPSGSHRAVAHLGSPTAALEATLEFTTDGPSASP